MVLKGIGVFLIILAGTGLGFSGVSQMNRRMRELKSMRRMALLLENEIGCAHTVLAQALSRIGKKLEGGCGEFVTGLSRKLRAGTGDGMEAMFREQAKEYQENWSLTQEDLQLLCQLGAHLGQESWNRRSSPWRRLCRPSRSYTGAWASWEDCFWQFFCCRR